MMQPDKADINSAPRSRDSTPRISRRPSRKVRDPLLLRRRFLSLRTASPHYPHVLIITAPLLKIFRCMKIYHSPYRLSIP